MRLYQFLTGAFILLGYTSTVSAQKKLVIIGSSTSACVAVDYATECYVSRLNAFYNKQAPFDTIIDNHLARSGSNCYNGMPSSFNSPYPGTGSIYLPFTDANITAALSLKPDVVLVNYPSNAYNVLSIAEIMHCLRTIKDSANKKGVACYISTTQPRTSAPDFNASAVKLKLAVLKDSILAAFGNFAIDFYTGLTNTVDSSMLYDSGDHIHMNGTGHSFLAQRVQAKNIFAAATIPPSSNGTGLQGVYYNGTTLAGTPLLTRTDTTINFELTYSKQPVVLSPAPGLVPEDGYSVRWTGKIQPLHSEIYTFYTVADDGIRLWVNNQLLVDNWVNQGATEKSGSIALLAGQQYNIVIEYFENNGEAITKLYWSSPGTAKAIVPKSQLFTAAVAPPVPPNCASNSAPLNGSTLSSATSANLAWNMITGATSYDVYLWSGANAPATPVANTTTNTFAAAGLTPSTRYNWYVVPKNSAAAAGNCQYNQTYFTTGAGGIVPGNGTGLQGIYYNGTSLSGTPLLARIDNSINFEFTYSKQPLVLSPAPGVVPEDLYSVRWTGQLQPLYAENYTFYTVADDGIRLWVNGILLVDNWTNQGATEKSGTIALVAGQKYDIVIEYYESGGEAVTKLLWSSASTTKQIVPTSQLYPPTASSSARFMSSNNNVSTITASPAVKAISASISPNPVRPDNFARLQITSNRTGTAVISVISANGRMLSTEKIKLVTGLNTAMINTRGLAQGLYIITVTGGSKPLNLKLLVE